MEAPHGYTSAAAKVARGNKIVKAAKRKAKETGKPIDLRGADLRGAHLEGADLRGADLTGADMADTSLARADLRGADLTRLKWGGLDCEVIALCDQPLFVVFTEEGPRFYAGSRKALTKGEMLACLNKQFENDLFGFRVEARVFIHAIENFEPKAKERA